MMWRIERDTGCGSGSRAHELGGHIGRADRAGAVHKSKGAMMAP